MKPTFIFRIHSKEKSLNLAFPSDFSIRKNYKIFCCHLLGVFVINERNSHKFILSDMYLLKLLFVIPMIDDWKLQN